MSTTTIYYKGPASFTGARLGAVLLGLGPVLSVLAIAVFAGSSWLPVGVITPVTWAATLLWCPMIPISIPALLTQDARDKAMPEYRGLGGTVVRGLRLLPYLLRDPRSSVRVETLASLVGFALALLVVVAR
jgi:hypothetical protein